MAGRRIGVGLGLLLIAGALAACGTTNGPSRSTAGAAAELALSDRVARSMKTIWNGRIDVGNERIGEDETIAADPGLAAEFEIAAEKLRLKRVTCRQQTDRLLRCVAVNSVNSEADWDVLVDSKECWKALLVSINDDGVDTDNRKPDRACIGKEQEALEAFRARPAVPYSVTAVERLSPDSLCTDWNQAVYGDKQAFTRDYRLEWLQEEHLSLMDLIDVQCEGFGVFPNNVKLGDLLTYYDVQPVEPSEPGAAGSQAPVSCGSGGCYQDRKPVDQVHEGELCGDEGRTWKMTGLGLYECELP